MWNNNNPYQQRSGPPPGQPGYTAPGQYAPPSGPPPGYNPTYNPSYAPPSGPPPGPFAFPQPQGAANSPGYHPSYAPPPGAPPPGPPPGPPPVPGNRPGNAYPSPSGPPPPMPQGAANSPGYHPSYAPPPGAPPPGPPPGPPPVPGNRPGNAYPSPSGPPPPMPHRASSGSGYPGQTYHQNQANQGNNGNGGSWNQFNPSYPGGTPVNWNQPGAMNSNNGPNNNNMAPGAWNNGPSGGQTGYGTGGPGHPGGQPTMGNGHMPPSGQQVYGPAQQSGQQMSFQYSMCTGKKRFLTIGINYKGQQGELKGCINDSNNLKEFLIRQYGYRDDQIVQLIDEGSDPMKQPTRDNIIKAMYWLVKDAQPNDSLFFHYSGHGGQTKDLDGDEADGFDEVIYPVDFERPRSDGQAGHIVDDDMHRIMVQSLPPGCRLTAIFDSCHSGSALDLPYIYSTEGKIKEPNLLADAGQGLLNAGLSYARGDMGGVVKGLGNIFKTATGSQKKADAIAKQTRTSAADVISWSGCKDSQTSADTVEAGEATGAMSYAFIEVLKRQPQQTYQELLNNIRGILRSKYSQKPQLSSSHPMDTTVLFLI